MLKQPSNFVVVVLNYNDAPTTIQFIHAHESISRIEGFIVVDNASTDDSLNQLKALESDRLVVLSASHNGGYAQGNNLGLRYAADVVQAKTVMLANPDTQIDEVALSACLAYLDEHPQSGLVAPRMMTPKGIERSAWPLPGFGDLLVRAFIPLRPFLNTKAHERVHKAPVQVVDVLAGSLWLARTDVLKNVGYFDESTFLYGEEQIFGHKLKAAGVDSVVINTITYRHEHSQSINKSIPSTRRKFELALQSHQIYLKNYLKVPTWKLTLYTLVYRLNLAVFLGLKWLQSKVAS